MAKPDKTPEDGTVPEQKLVRPFNGAENATKFKDAWGKSKKDNPKVLVSVPGTRRSVEFSKVETDDKKLSVWVGEDTTQAADFVIVNPPTEVLDSSGALIEDPLTAIALIIDGATK